MRSNDYRWSVRAAKSLKGIRYHGRQLVQYDLGWSGVMCGCCQHFIRAGTKYALGTQGTMYRGYSHVYVCCDCADSGKWPASVLPQSIIRRLGQS